jgi:hypothetical protein
MSRRILITVAALVVLSLTTAAQQQPPRPSEQPRSVTLTLAEYNRLVDLANRPQPGVPQAPVAAVVSSADLRVRVDGDAARGIYTLTGEALRDGISRIALLSGATLIDASTGGRPLPLVVVGAAHAALIEGPAPFSLALDWGAPLTYTPGRASFQLPVPQAGTARTTIDLPGEQADVRLSAGLITRRAVANGRTLIEATLDPGSTAEVWWTMRDSAPAAAAREVRALADVMTLVTIGDSDLRMAALIDVKVVQGELRTLTLGVPAGYEVTGISGSTVETSTARDDGITLTLSDPAARAHQVLVTLERPYDGGSATLDTGFVTVPDMQRERGEIAVEGGGTLDLVAAEREGMQRLDVRELHYTLQSMSRLPLLAAFRYQRTAAFTPGVALAITRFADTGVLAAVADSARITTLLTSEGRTLTEVTLRVQNRAQPFLKVTLPAGSSMVSVDIAGETAKPVLGTDGIRVPLLRPGFRPSGPYDVSFVYTQPGTPFARKGDLRLPLPTMDLPIGIVEWELFVPEQYEARAVDGNVLVRAPVSGKGGPPVVRGGVVGGAIGGLTESTMASMASDRQVDGQPGQLRGRVTDSQGSSLPGVTVSLEASGVNRSAVSDQNGNYAFSAVPQGRVSMRATLPGFGDARMALTLGERARQIDFEMHVGGLTETLVVMGDTPVIDVQSAARSVELSGRELREQIATPSENIVNLQRRTAGVLPVRVDVPRAGTSHRFVRPLVIDQETFVTLRYKRR